MQQVSLNDIMVALRHNISERGGIDHNAHQISAAEALRLVQNGVRAGECRPVRRKQRENTVFRVGKKVHND
jgi:hypothetical protein